MKKPQTNISSLDELNSTIRLLKKDRDLIEHQLEKNWEHLNSNFPAMLRSTLFHRVKEKTSAGWAQTLFTIPKVQEAVSDTLVKISGKLEAVVLHWIDKLLSKKD